MTNLTREMVLLLVDGREYRVAFMREDGEFDIVDCFMAVDDSGANAYAETYFGGEEWYVLDADGRNINAGREQA